jgi:glycosyltransferase involved in cell wall biosynthesis
MKACKSIPGVTFEGELFMRPGYHAPGYEGITQPKSAGHRTYIEKTKASCVVFNTPSVHSCHSWKLGEYLALGKAIISLPIIRDLPSPLVHGVHVHYVDGTPDSMREAVMLIREDAAYRARLEANAREYHDRYLAPAVMMKRLLAIDQANATATDESPSLLPSGGSPARD